MGQDSSKRTTGTEWVRKGTLLLTPRYKGRVRETEDWLGSCRGIPGRTVRYGEPRSLATSVFEEERAVSTGIDTE